MMPPVTKAAAETLESILKLAAAINATETNCALHTQTLSTSFLEGAL